MSGTVAVHTWRMS